MASDILCSHTAAFASVLRDGSSFCVLSARPALSFDEDDDDDHLVHSHHRAGRCGTTKYAKRNKTITESM